MAVESQSVQGFITDYGNGLSFWVFQHDGGNHTLQFEGGGQVYAIQGIQKKDAIRIAAAIMRLFGGDVYEPREDCESEMGND